MSPRLRTPPGWSGTCGSCLMSRSQTPLYYMSMVPVWLAADRLGGPFAAVYHPAHLQRADRRQSRAYVCFGRSRAGSGSGRSCVVAAVFAVILPGLDLNGTRVSNDALAAAIGGLIVLLAVRWAAMDGLGGALPWWACSSAWAHGQAHAGRLVPRGGPVRALGRRSTRHANLRRLTLSGAIAFACVVRGWWGIFSSTESSWVGPHGPPVRCRAGVVHCELHTARRRGLHLTYWTG